MTKTNSLAFSMNKETKKEPPILKQSSNQYSPQEEQPNNSNEIDVKTYKIMEENSQEDKTNDCDDGY